MRLIVITSVLVAVAAAAAYFVLMRDDPLELAECPPGRRAQIDALLSWAGDRARLHPALAVAGIAGGGCGFRARYAVPAKQELVFVDKSLLLCDHTAPMVLDPANPERQPDWGPDPTRANKLALLLLLERAKGEQSDWAPYIAALPPLSAFDHLWFSFDDDDLSLVSKMRPTVRSKLDGARAAWEEYRAFMRQRVCDPFAKTLPPSVCSKQALAWAFVMRNSRSFAKGKAGDPAAWAQCFVPVGDLFNHAADGAHWEMGTLDADYSAKATVPLQAGAEAFLRYLPFASAAHIFFNYGFVATDATVHLSSPSPAAPDRRIPGDCLPIRAEIASLGAGGQLTDYYFQCLRLIYADADDWAMFEALPKPWLAPVSLRNEKQILSSIVDVLSYELRHFKAIDAWRRERTDAQLAGLPERTRLLLDFATAEQTPLQAALRNIKTEMRHVTERVRQLTAEEERISGVRFGDARKRADAALAQQAAGAGAAAAAAAAAAAGKGEAAGDTVDLDETPA